MEKSKKKVEYFVTENNSGGCTKVLSCSIDKATKKKPHIVKILAESVDEAIKKFEKKFKINWMNENSFEGGSCNCCGRRFKLDVVNGKKEDNDWGIKYIWVDNDYPYEWTDKKYIKMVIK